ncbi:hypothetical protein AB0F59_33830 [Micromonospora lupini]|uniref:hypothetical protein n=1 Tax=Micromonospora lupini TaxID=285679 RepID=UPI0033F82607
MHDPAVLDGLAELTDVRMLWFADYYDGPLDGLALFDGREYWFIAVADEHGVPVDQERRCYVLHAISEEQAQAEWADHRDFVAVVGGPGCVHTPSCTRGPGGAEATAAWHRDHPWDLRPDHASAPAIGWFRG